MKAAIVLFLLLPAINQLAAQERIERVLTLNEMFALAIENSKQLQLSRTNIEKAKKATDVAKNSRLPSINASLSISYLGDGTIIDREFTNAKRAPMPHFGNNFSIEASQVVFAGGIHPEFNS